MSLAATTPSTATVGDAEFCLSELEARLEMTAFGGGATPAYVCCECTFYGCNGEAQ